MRAIVCGLGALFCVGLISSSVYAYEGSRAATSSAASAAEKREQRLQRECRDKNIIWETMPDGSRRPVRPALSDGAEYVWRDGTCKIVGGLPYTPPPKPN